MSSNRKKTTRAVPQKKRSTKGQSGVPRYAGEPVGAGFFGDIWDGIKSGVSKLRDSKIISKGIGAVQSLGGDALRARLEPWRIGAEAAGFGRKGKRMTRGGNRKQRSLNYL